MGGDLTLSSCFHLLLRHCSACRTHAHSSKTANSSHRMLELQQPVCSTFNVPFAPSTRTALYVSFSSKDLNSSSQSTGTASLPCSPLARHGNSRTTSGATRMSCLSTSRVSTSDGEATNHRIMSEDGVTVCYQWAWRGGEVKGMRRRDLGIRRSWSRSGEELRPT